MITEKKQEEILQFLDRISEKHNICILLAVELGSRGWGFASNDSDYDVRILYKHKNPQWYLSVLDRDETIEEQQGTIDVAGWDIRKAMRLMRKSNASLIEWISSPIIYTQDKKFHRGLRAMLKEVSLKALGFHYYRFARKDYKQCIEGQERAITVKKLLYILRTLLSAVYVYLHRRTPPVVMTRVLDVLEGSAYLGFEDSVWIRQIIYDKADWPEVQEIDLSSQQRGYIKLLREHVAGFCELLPAKHMPVELLDGLLATTIQQGNFAQ